MGWALTLGGLHIFDRCNKQLDNSVSGKGGISEEKQPVQNMWGGHLPIIWGGKLSKEMMKIMRGMGDGSFGLDGH